MCRRICSMRLWGILACLMLCALSLQADPIDCAATFPCAIGQGWTVFVTPNGNDVNLKDITFEGSTFTLTKQATFNNLNPLIIEFLGPALADPANPSPTQAFFNVTEKITNQTPFDWGAFQFDIIDQNPVTADGTVHPRKAHFHFKPFKNSDRFMNLPQPIDASDSGTYTGTASAPDIVGKNGDTWNASILRMHDRVDPDPANAGLFFRMDFKLVETPIPTPEPGTLSLLGFGILALWCTRFRKTSPDSRR
jgi:hypothetical protein